MTAAEGTRHTVGSLLTDGVRRLREAGSDTPRLDAELLLGHAIGLDRTAVIAHRDAPVGADAARLYEEAIGRRAAGEPVAYIRGVCEFHGLAFTVDARVLIPRPETEGLVDLALSEIASRLTAAPRPPGSPPLRVVDAGTGSGAIAITVAVVLRKRRMLDDVRILATDDSADALQVARENAVGHGVADRVAFLEADLLPPVAEPRLDVVTANLPYVRSDAMPSLPQPVTFEPTRALDGGPDGLTVIRRLLGQLPERLAGDGVALLEIGADQGQTVVGLAGELVPSWTIDVQPDHAGRPRVARVRPPRSAA